ncbi:hypothetical protein FA09DRAFT_330282 [Tilletiopsis washingtonensis]|uniref:Uncharacterized protein n=1 Tax=Tilletiopsis washingtonensis TaxID=58919 RepID=A0A316Z762_9BASI|nr:hypothetical protein FA09DRAFT_330282 [Tilletiopsis washingtonensis]PWN97610.1 hypothetical protein FA09DRAFT_330282 [Tilletiopsis washingtonensis]
MRGSPLAALPAQNLAPVEPAAFAASPCCPRCAGRRSRAVQIAEASYGRFVRPSTLHGYLAPLRPVHSDVVAASHSPCGLCSMCCAADTLRAPPAI